jgi:hypothetical protein
VNTIIAFLIHIYSRLLLFYPSRFRDEFAEEMRVVFKDSLNEAARDGTLALTLVCVREFGGLATHILQELWREVERKETVMATNKNSRSMIGREMNRWVLKVAAAALAFVTFAWFYTSTQLSSARSKGIYSSPQQGIQAIVDQMYSADREVKILNAGPYFFSGRQPQLWYVIAEVHATSHADGSSLKYHGCESPGIAFIQTREGWVHVPDIAFPEFIGFWMKVFGWAGEGQSTPSTDSAPDQLIKFCD